MNRSSLLVFLSAAGFAFTSAAAPIPNEYIVVVKNGGSAPLVAARNGVVPAFVYSKVLNGFAGTIPPGRLNAVQQDPQVAAVLVNHEVFAFAKPGGGGGAAGQVAPEGVKRVGAAPGTLAYTGTGIGVAVVDTGVDLQHTDLNVVNGFSAFGASADDDHGHGTHVAGTIAALDNTIDVVGVAPGATLFAVKVLNSSGSGSDASVIAGLDWVASNADSVSPPIRVVNMSLGRGAVPGSLEDAAMQTAVQGVVGAGVTVVVAAGNDCGAETSDMVPAGFEEVISVASITAKDGTKNRFGFQITGDTASYFTTDGPNVTISGPGEDQENVNNGFLISSVGILSTRNGGGTTRMSGTSMASPHVAGVVALLYQQADGTLDPAVAKGKIIAGASNAGIAPKNSPTSCYTFDGVREGVASAPGSLSVP